jgi:hypothetical protein
MPDITPKMKPKGAVEPGAAKQAVVAAFVPQHEDAQEEETHQ